MDKQAHQANNNTPTVLLSVINYDDGTKRALAYSLKYMEYINRYIADLEPCINIDYEEKNQTVESQIIEYSSLTDKQIIVYKTTRTGIDLPADSDDNSFIYSVYNPYKSKCYFQTFEEIITGSKTKNYANVIRTWGEQTSQSRKQAKTKQMLLRDIPYIPAKTVLTSSVCWGTDDDYEESTNSPGLNTVVLADIPSAWENLNISPESDPRAPGAIGPNRLSILSSASKNLETINITGNWDSIDFGYLELRKENAVTRINIDTAYLIKDLTHVDQLDIKAVTHISSIIRTSAPSHISIHNHPESIKYSFGAVAKTRAKSGWTNTTSSPSELSITIDNLAEIVGNCRETRQSFIGIRNMPPEINLSKDVRMIKDSLTLSLDQELVISVQSDDTEIIDGNVTDGASIPNKTLIVPTISIINQSRIAGKVVRRAPITALEHQANKTCTRLKLAGIEYHPGERVLSSETFSFLSKQFTKDKLDSAIQTWLDKIEPGETLSSHQHIRYEGLTPIHFIIGNQSRDSKLLYKTKTYIIVIDEQGIYKVNITAENLAEIINTEHPVFLTDTGLLLARYTNEIRLTYCEICYITFQVTGSILNITRLHTKITLDISNFEIVQK